MLKSAMNLSTNGSQDYLTDYDPRLSPQIQWGTIPPGTWGILITLETMANLARLPNSKVSNYAANLLGGDSPSDSVGFCDRLDTWLRSTFRYRSEEKEIVRTPGFMLNDLDTLGYSEGDCDDVATLACGLAYAVGISSRLASIASVYGNPGRELDHVFAEIQTPNGWCIIDPTVDKGTIYNVYSVYYEPVS